MRQRLAVIGYPLGHTLSPAIHGAAVRALGLDLTYEAVETPPHALGGFLGELRGDGWLGCNVTVPHKQAVMAHVDELGDEACAIGAVNTVMNREGRLSGFNTDAQGFLADLQQRFGSPSGKVVAVLGAGGAARAVCFALRQAGAERIWVLNRTHQRAEELARTFGANVGGRDELQRCQLIVNCTSAGLRPGDSPIPDEWLPAGAELYDLIYNPAETRLMKMVRERGGTAVNGLGMLVRQAAASFRLWTGVEPPLMVMFKAAEEALRERAHA
jgi:shikimate dehydrogenase